MRKWFKRLVIASLVLIIAGAFLKNYWVGDSIGVLEIVGGIYSADETLKEIEELRYNPSVKAVVVRIDSPGGTVAAAQEIYESLKTLAGAKPLVASMGSVAASGGYYVALASPHIYANPGTITGSIGVRMEHVEIGELLEWAKIHYQNLKSGEFKDIGSVQRPMTPEEKQMLEEMLKEIHLQFKNAVATARNISLDEVGRFADGRVLTGEQAHKLKLVDALGGFETAVKKAQELAKMKGRPAFFYAAPREGWWLKFLTKISVWSTRAALPLFEY